MFLGHFAVGLWYSVAATLGVELTIFGAALMLFVRGAPEVARRRSFVLLIAVLLIGYAAAAFGPPPPGREHPRLVRPLGLDSDPPGEVQ